MSPQLAPERLSTLERLAVFAPSMAGGGAERGAVKLAEGLANRGYEADLVLSRAVGPRMAEIPSDVRLVDLAAKRVLTSLPALVRYLRRERPAAIASVLDHANIVLLWAAWLARYRGRVIVIEQNTLSEAAANGSSRRARIIPSLAARFYGRADAVVGVSIGVVDDLVRTVGIAPDRARVIFNPIITPDLFNRSRQPVEHPWFADSVPVLVAAGRLRPQKDFELLLRAFAISRSRRPARLVILGEGSERVTLERLVAELDLAESVSMPGEVANPYAYMSKAAAFVLSSRWEGLPTVLIEALGCGVPVVATDCPSGPREILAGGRYGVLVPVGEAEPLAEALDRALANDIPVAPPESWHPYRLESVVDAYLGLMVGAR